jgi:hypothetical protein
MNQKIGLAIISCLAFTALLAQSEKDKLVTTITTKDSLFWRAYNNCDTSKMHEFLAEDLEFYHDKGGPTFTAAKLLEVSQKNLCSNENYRLRREAVPGTVKVFSMEANGTIYGAVISGEHYFYVWEKGKEEFRDGWAKFTHLWLLKDGVWKMSRILSFDHAPAPYLSTRKEIKLSKAALDQFKGKYKGAQTGEMTVETGDGLLILRIKNDKFLLYPQSPTVFFTKDRDLTFEFTKNEKNKVSKMTVKEKGNVAEEVLPTQ